LQDPTGLLIALPGFMKAAPQHLKLGQVVAGVDLGGPMP
jgi:hypothetical protein